MHVETLGDWLVFLVVVGFIQADEAAAGAVGGEVDDRDAAVVGPAYFEILRRRTGAVRLMLLCFRVEFPVIH